ncbi:MAG: hypothetical protein FWB88_07445 [Defluviitaleaceae bacterium]|nr:hypothetical protein [Defluviitaleaceae bacterium]MCL2239319.1 hypothetical protein [Defluviitaleaceae bacterium]
MKKIVLLLFIFFVVHAPISVRATVGPLVNHATILVDGEAFTIWGVGNDVALSSVRLRDLAYIVKDTPARFKIRESDDPALGYWIIRGAAYTPAGDVLQPIEYYLESFGEEWSDPRWFMGQFTRVLIGVDGTYAPETVIEFITYEDAYDFYFPLHSLGVLLGFEVVWSRVGYFIGGMQEEYFEGVWYVIETGRERAELPVQTVEYLDLMWRLTQWWVDDAHFYSEAVDESTVWPLELFFRTAGHGAQFSSWQGMGPMRHTAPYFWRYWYPMEMYTLEDGRVALRIADSPVRAWYDAPTEAPAKPPVFSGRRCIVIDTAQEELEKITLYIDGNAHRMIRPFGPDGSVRTARRYTVGANDEGHIVLRYMLGAEALWNGDGIHIYRATGPSWQIGDIGTRMYSRNELSHDDRLLFEFIDTTAQPGQVYYYTIISTGFWGLSVHYISATQFQMRADVDALRGATGDYAAEYTKTYNGEDENEYGEEAVVVASGVLNGLFGALLVVFLIAAGFFIVRNKSKRRHIANCADVPYNDAR